MPIFPSENRKNRKRRLEDGDDDSARYEKTARTQFAEDSGAKMKMLLPIKDKGRVIPQMVELEEENEEDEVELEETGQNKGMTICLHVLEPRSPVISFFVVVGFYPFLFVSFSYLIFSLSLRLCLIVIPNLL